LRQFSKQVSDYVKQVEEIATIDTDKMTQESLLMPQLTKLFCSGPYGLLLLLDDGDDGLVGRLSGHDETGQIALQREFTHS
jgi:hypothetical protein